MDKKYITLFKDLAQATAASAETVIEYNQSKNDEKGVTTATTMRDDFQELVDRIKEAGDDYAMTQPDAARLLVGSMVMVNQLQDRIAALRKAVAGYQTDVIPKLQEIVDKAGSDNELAQKMANEKFIIEEK
jgi:ABC-type transporter Mla subunit MlaD